MRKSGLKYRYEYRSKGGKWVKWSPTLTREGSKKPDKYWFEADFAVETPKDSRLGKLIIRFTEEL